MSSQNQLQKQVFTLKDGTQISTIVSGPPDGSPVVLLHGGGSDNALLSWRDTIPALAGAGYRVYAPNYPGYGDSPPDNRASSMNGLIQFLEGMMDAWGLEKAALVGLSMGGALAIGYALANPGRVKRLVLIGPYGIQDRTPFHFLSYLYVKIPWVLDAAWALMRNSKSMAQYTLNNILHNPQARTEAMFQDVMEAMQNPHSQRIFAQWQRDEIRPNRVKTNYTERLPEIAVPVLMLHGTHDVGVPLAYAQCAAARFQNAHLEVIENAGHWTQRDYPDLVNQHLLAFLQGGTA